ncbi:MAG TPA: translation initiation factor eIF-2B [Bacteroidota bacterium]|nr:translation initiation factor eIF-2B [Bacteroidota bacterium]
MTLPGYVNSEIASIESDNVSGAEVIMQRCANVLERVGQDPGLNDAGELQGALREAARLLVNAQPAMAGVFNIANAFLWVSDRTDTIQGLRERVAETGRRFSRFGDEHLALIAGRAARLVQPGQTILTHSNSSTVFRALVEARKLGKEFSVICTESRPMLEGVTLAQGLAEAGIRVELVTDAGVFSLIGRAQCVLFGADAVSSQGLVNKAGTLGIATVARSLVVPCYALCSTAKISPLPGTLLVQREGNRHEALPRPSPNVTPVNHYFDLTPLELLTGIITEEGTMPILAVRVAISALNIHPLLR